MSNIRIFLGGDVMLGRGIDQILAHPSSPKIYEPYIKDARDYVLLAEKQNGKIHYPVSREYIWGDALTFWREFKPNLKIINLETAITQSNHYFPDKDIHYRMHPLNVNVLSAAEIDVCTLANNHILDWGEQGLSDTITTLKNAGINIAGAGNNIQQAMQPIIFNVDTNKRILIFAAGTESSGVPKNWQATKNKPGIYFLSDLNKNVITNITENIKQFKQKNDLIIFSIHWGSNWGYEISNTFQAFAHDLIDIAQVDVVFGHSSHHPRPIEIYHGKPILYGCGDFINDYEGIGGREEYRGDLSLMYFLDFDNTNLQFKKLTLIPLQMKQFRLYRANTQDYEWMSQILHQYSNIEFILQERHVYISKLLININK